MDEVDLKKSNKSSEKPKETTERIQTLPIKNGSGTNAMEESIEPVFTPVEQKTKKQKLSKIRMCPNCKIPLKKNYRFCLNCGTPVKEKIE